MPTEESKTHAGVEELSLNLVVFQDEEQLRSLINRIGLHTDDSGRILDDENHIKTCPSCSEQLQLKDVGHILPGSHYIYCKNPVCIMDYFERFG